MGMFDYVNYSCKCPNCNHTMEDFQTKDMECDLIVVEIENVDNFYDFCSECDCRVEFCRIDKERFERTILNKDLNIRSIRVVRIVPKREYITIEINI